MQNSLIYKLWIACGVIAFFTCTAAARAQVTPITGVDPSAMLSAAPSSQRGVGSQTSATESADNATIVLGSQSYTYTIPLLHLPGRSGLDINLNLFYNSQVWPLNSNSTNADYDTPSLGFRLDFGMFDYGAVFMDGDGTKHPLMTVPDVDPRYYVHYQTTDSTYIQITGSKFTGVCPGPANCQQPNLTVMFKNGLKGTYENFNFQHDGGFRPIQFTDTHGSQITIAYMDGISLHISSITDSVGRLINFGYDSGGRLVSLGYGQHLFQFSWNPSYAAKYNFGTLITLPPISVLTGVTRPNGTGVKFQYGDWTIVNEIDEVSSAGNVRYSTNYNFPLASAGALSANPTFTKQTVFDGINSNILWNYAVTTNSDTGVTTLAITDPTGVTTTNITSADGLVAQRQITTLDQSGQTKVWRTINQSWTQDAAGLNQRLAAVSTILENGAASAVAYVAYDANGNVTDLKDFDFSPPSPGNLSLPPGTIPTTLGSLLREMLATYAPLTGISNRPSQVLIKDGQTTLSRTDYTYDEGSTTGVHGDLTSIIRYANAAAGSGGVKTSITYDSFGNALTTQEGCCAFTQQIFSAATNFAYPDSASVGPQGSQLTTTITYNPDGTVLNSTDPNGVIVTYAYDAEGRVINMAQSLGITVTTSFDDASLNAAVKVSNTQSNLVTVRTLDGLGRTLQDQSYDGSALVSTAAYINDALGRPVQISNPFGPSTAPIYRTVAYDALDRITQSTPPAASAGGSQNSYGAFYSGATVTFSDPAGRQRKHYTDALGRLVRVDEPGQFGGAYASGAATISGADQSVTSTSANNGATAGTAVVSVTGVERSTSILTHAATSASVTVTIGGSNGTNSRYTTICNRTSCRIITTNFADSGTMQYSVNIGGTVITSQSVPYDSTKTQASLAAALASALPANALVTASYGGASSFILTTTATGTSTNSASLSTGITTSCTTSGDTDTASTACRQGWTITPAQNFSGGSDNIFTMFYDTGNVTISITANGSNYSKISTYGQGSTPSSIVNDLYSKFIADSSFNQLVRVNPPGSGNSLQFTTVANGANTNYPLSASALTSSSNFAAGSTSFTVSPSGFTSFTPGQNGLLYDSGTIAATLTGFTNANPPRKQVSFGQGSTPAGVAALLASQIHNDPAFPVDANVSAGSATINLTAKDIGADGNNYALVITEASNYPSSFSSPSFSATSGQLASGVDPSPSFDPSVVLITTYSYDPVGNLKQVNQGQQTRTYLYDGLSHLTSSCVPETANQCTTYNYTDSGPLQQKIDPRVLPNTATHVTTTYGYDTLGRLNDIQYNDGTPRVHYTFGAAGAAFYGVGRVTTVTDGTGSKAYRYNPSGQMTQVTQTIGSNSYITQYSYSNGHLTSITYPSGRVINRGYDSLGRFNQVGSNGSSIFSIGSFNDAGQVLTTTYGNGMHGTYGYNNRLQLGSIQFGAASTLMSLGYSYNGQSNNGQITGITDNVSPVRSQAFVYDELGRLRNAQTSDLTSPGTWKLKFGYDRYANRLEEVPQAGTAQMPLNELVVDPLTNRIMSSGTGYDAAGNMIADGTHTYGFDAENRIVQVDGSANIFAYDADGLRVVKNGNCYIYWGDVVIAEYPGCATGASNTPSVEYIYAGGQRVASIVNGSTAFLYHDHLSTRVSADASGNIAPTFGHFPFGEVWYEPLSADKWKFTTYERDGTTEGGLDYADARFYSPAFGRFTSLDQLAGSVGGPQSLNRFAYVVDDPINLTDPTGMYSSLDLCMLDDKGDITTNCAQLGYSSAVTALFALWGFEEAARSDSFLKGDLFSNAIPSGNPLDVAEAAYSKMVKAAFDAAKTERWWNELSGTPDDKCDAVNCEKTKINDSQTKYDFSKVWLYSVGDFKDHPDFKKPFLGQSDSGLSDLIQKYLKYKSPAVVVPKVAVKASSGASGQGQLRLPPAGSSCFRADGWQLLESTFWNPVAYLEATSSSVTTCVK